MNSLENKIKELEIENSFLKSANQKLYEEKEQWRQTAYAERDLNKILGKRIATLLEQPK